MERAEPHARCERRRLPGGGEYGEYGLYLHTPFCATKCPYCDFASGVFPESEVVTYLEAVGVEIERTAADPALAPLVAAGVVTSIFCGGGTPSHLSGAALAQLVGALRARFRIAAGAEFTVEANPESLTAEKAELLRDLGVSRLSLGVQSLDDTVLKRLGRPHDAASALAAARVARSRFPRLNVDLIFAVPGLTRASLGASLDRLLDVGPDHLSAYGLTVEPGTPFGALRARGALGEFAEEDYLAADELIEERAARAGLRRYEVSNYARPGAECRHNLDIWRGGFYLGLGPSAHSYLPGGTYGMRRANVSDLHAYAARLRRGEAAAPAGEAIDREQAMAERLLLGLRLAEGIDLAAFAHRFGVAVEVAAGAELDLLLAGGWLAAGGGRLRVTRAGLPLLDTLLGRLTARLAAA